MSLMDRVMEIIYWIQIFLSPFLISIIVAVIAYFNIPDNYWLPIGILITGASVGIILAERIRRKYGTTTYMGRIRGNSEFIENDTNKKSK
jgi:membrane protein YdbS with pleckstrin-like domain